MPLEFVPAPHPKSLESLKIKFKDRLDAILYKQLTVENIETFADEALSEIIALTDDILKEYKNNPEFHAPATALNTKEQEDEAFRMLDLQNIPDVLRQIIDKKEQISILKTYINKNIEKINEVITPPQQDQVLNIEKGNGGFERKKIFSRLLTLLYILEHDFDITPTPERVPIKEGTVTPNMMRKTPYIRVEIPELERVVYICEEENNVGYVFDAKKLAEKSLTLEEIDIYNKEDKNSLIIKYPGIGIRLVQSAHWRDRIYNLLQEPIPEIQKESQTEQREENIISKIDTPTVVKGELDPWRGFWTDTNGMHWGNRHSIAKKLGKTHVIFKKRIRDPRLKILIVLDLLDRPQNSYCFEQLVELFPELKKENVVHEGNWYGFWTDEKTKKHWAPAHMLANKFAVKDSTTITKYAKKANLKYIDIQGLSGYHTKAYCYEDFLEIDEFVDFLTAPQVKKEGEWSGFLTDEKKQHWGHPNVLAQYFDTTSNTINMYAEKMNLTGKSIKTRAESIQTAFCLESFKANEEFMEFVNLPRVAKEGYWSGFWTDENNNHWGPISQISKKLGIPGTTMHGIINKHSKKLNSVFIKDTRGKSHKCFCLEEIKKLKSN